MKKNQPGKIAACNPIGIFDSGIGGLTVADAIHRLLPDESLVYFGDTAHLPYGDKAPESIREYAVKITRFLLSHKCKLIVIACNTASAVAGEKVRKEFSRHVPVVDVISPVVSFVCNDHKLKHVGVIGTRATIRSDVYANKIQQKKPRLEVSSVATPLLAPMIEEGFFNNNISRTIIHSYLARPKLKKIDALILGCTHYPLIKPEISGFFKSKVDIVDSAEVVAVHVREILKKNKLLCPDRLYDHQFFVSDFTKSFEKSTRIFFRDRIKLQRMNLWKDITVSGQ